MTFSPQKSLERCKTVQRSSCATLFFQHIVYVENTNAEKSMLQNEYSYLIAKSPSIQARTSPPKSGLPACLPPLGQRKSHVHRATRRERIVLRQCGFFHVLFRRSRSLQFYLRGQHLLLRGCEWALPARSMRLSFEVYAMP